MTPAEFWAWFGCSLALSLFGDGAMKRAGEGRISWGWVCAGMVAYTLTSIGWLVMLRVRKLSTFGTLYPLANAIGLVAIGAAVFGERLTAREWAGVGLGAVAMILLSTGK